MTETGTPATDRLSRQQSYRRLMIGFVLGGTAVALLLREVLGYPLVGEVIYWLGVAGFVVVLFGTSVELFDERDRALERRASHLTLLVFAVLLPVAASAARVLPRITALTVPDWLGHALYAYIALFVVWVVAYLFVRYGSR